MKKLTITIAILAACGVTAFAAVQRFTLTAAAGATATLSGSSWGTKNVEVTDVFFRLAAADSGDDIISDKQFKGIGMANAVDIFNTSGLYSVDNVSQTVDVRFRVYIPLGTLWGEYTARVATTINQKT